MKSAALSLLFISYASAFTFIPSPIVPSFVRTTAHSSSSMQTATSSISSSLFAVAKKQSTPFPTTSTAPTLEKVTLLSPPTPFHSPQISDTLKALKLNTPRDLPIDCYIDAYVTIKDKRYAVGTPCDYCVSLTYVNAENGKLESAEDDPVLMDRLFPVAAKVVDDEFGEDLGLVFTGESLTLVGEIDLDDDSDEDEESSDIKDRMDMEEVDMSIDEDEGEGEEDDEDFDNEKLNDKNEEVELLLSFEFEDREYSLVRLLDPILLVGKVEEDKVTLLSDAESEDVLPIVEKLFEEEMFDDVEGEDEEDDEYDEAEVKEAIKKMEAKKEKDKEAKMKKEKK